MSEISYAAQLPAGVRSRMVRNNNGLDMHVLDAGYEEPGRPAVLLLHGFPELAFSWRKVIPFVASQGFHVIAPDQRGYGLTTGWDGRYDGDLDEFRMANLVQDVLGLVSAQGYRSVEAVIGHDFGSPVAAYAALIRPDVFRAVVMMSSPFGGPPQMPLGSVEDARETPAASALSSRSIHDDLAALVRPRKHYQWYYSTREANDDMWRCPQGVHDFLRAYYHHKSADWAANNPVPLEGWVASEIARLPTYYVMDQAKNMAETVAEEMPGQDAIDNCEWLSEAELSVYSGEYERIGFQGGLQWYRCMTSPHFSGQLRLFSGRTIDVPAMFIAGRRDWGIYQKPGDIENMQSTACTDFRGCHLIERAGHWVQQEQPAEVNGHIGAFLDGLGKN
ncbi:MAG: alpha/beta fold hydrolase [Hyphomicrobiaceae bacterium]